MEFSALYQQYQNMTVPSYTLKVGGTELKTGEDAVLLYLDCELTCRQKAGCLMVEVSMNPKGENGAKWLKALQTGVECSLSLGYGKKQTEVFCGFLYEVQWSDPLAEGALELSAMFLDVRGRLMTSSCADAGAARTVSQLVKTILDQSCCRQLAGKQKISQIPKDWDLPIPRSGYSDYEVLCQAADFLCYEFYVCGGELYFGEPRPETSPAVTFSGHTGLMKLTAKRTLAGQCAAVVVSGTDDKGDRIMARQARAKDSGFGTEKMGSVLSNDVHHPESTVRTMAQAKYLAKAQMEQRQHQSGGLSGKCLGTPELRPGRFIQVKKLSQPVNGTYYVHTVRHVLDIDGYNTYFEAED